VKKTLNAPWVKPEPTPEELAKQAERKDGLKYITKHTGLNRTTRRRLGRMMTLNFRHMVKKQAKKQANHQTV